ncbi:MAG: heme exporter protein CcmD [Xanthomonadales bacterium]
MDHTPFIAGAYGIGAVILLWTALSPLLRKKKITQDIRRLIELEERSGDAKT